MNENTQVAPELGQIEVENVSRSAFLMRGVLAAGAAYGALAVGPMVRQAFAQAEDGDIEILNFALTLEYLESAYYATALKEAKLDSDASDLAKLIGGHEAEHVEALAATITDLGGKPVKEPGVDFGDAFSSQDAFLKLAITFEDTGVSAYNGAAPDIQSKELLATAGGIVQVEGRHAAAVRFLAGEPPAPEGFDPSLTGDQVIKAVTPFLA